MTVADSVKLAPRAGLPLLTDGAVTSRSGNCSPATVTASDVEQLFVVSVSPEAASHTHRSNTSPHSMARS
ncbi:MAG: hypothetical protein OXC31_12605, partial [Spirochaetaceae bacterium]|nr:hypothetical protein [Spirochaetaceae bacterium]